MTILSGNWLRKSEARERVAEEAQIAHDFLVRNGYSLYRGTDGRDLSAMFGCVLGTRSKVIDFRELGIPSELAVNNREEYIGKLAQIAQREGGIRDIVHAMNLPSQPQGDYEHYNIEDIRTFVECPSLDIWFNGHNSNSLNASLRITPSPLRRGKYFYEGEKGYEKLCKELKEIVPFDRLVLSGEVYHGLEFNGRGGLNERMTRGLVEAVRATTKQIEGVTK